MSDSTTAMRRPWLAFTGIAFVSLVAAMPGLLGGWVGDDFHMLNSRYYGDWKQVWGVFTRHAGHYLESDGAPGGTWPYRPVTMLTLLVSHALVPRPWLHHLLSWAMHMATGALLYVAMLRQERFKERLVAPTVVLFLTALFLLHPVAVETYVWINGRSDLVAGLCLAALAVALSDRRIARPWRAILIALLAFLGAGSKLPFLVAAFALWAGIALRDSHRDPRWRSGVPLFIGLAGYLALRWIYVPLAGRIGASESIFADGSLWKKVPHLLAKSAEAILIFRVEAMQSLAWELHQPWSPGEWIGAIAALAAVAAFGWRRDLGGLAYLIGAALVIAPTAIVSQAIWLGFDRYLYMPAILLWMAGAPYVVAAVDSWSHRRVLWLATGSALVLVAALGTRAASLAYVSQATYERALISDHPDDPTTIFYLAKMAKESGQHALARRTLAKMPEPPWPSALIMPAFALASELSDSRLRDLAIVHGLEAHSDDPVLRAHAMRWKYGRGEIDEALALARSFGVDDVLCGEVRRQLELWARRADEEARQKLEEASGDMRCADDAQ